MKKAILVTGKSGLKRRKRGAWGSGKLLPAKFLDCQVCYDPCRVGDDVSAVTCGTCVQHQGPAPS